MSDPEFPADADEEKFYAAIGRAITAWADVEDKLFAITFSILGCSRERAAIVFYRTPTIDSRLTLTNDLINSFFPKHEPGEQPDPRLRRWREIQALIKAHLPIRNRLAHHPTGLIVDLSDDDAPIIHASQMSSSERLRRGQSEPLQIEAVRAHRQIVRMLVNELRNFHRQEFQTTPLAPGEQDSPHTPPRDRQDTDRKEAPPPPPESSQA